MPQASKQSRSPRRPPAKTSSAESGHRSAGAAGGEDALADTSDRILEAAGQIFATKGFHRATIREICKAAEANVSAVNYHFGDKRNLYREVFRYALRQADGEHPVPAPPVPGEAPGEATRRVVGALLGRFITAHEGWRGRLIARELADPSEILGEVLESHGKHMLGSIAALVARMRPDLAAEAQRLHVFSLMGQCVFYAHARPILDRQFGVDTYRSDRIPELTEHITQVFLSALQAPAQRTEGRGR